MSRSEKLYSTFLFHDAYLRQFVELLSSIKYHQV